jgi:DNA-binding IclR family transcriptional regulator
MGEDNMTTDVTAYARAQHAVAELKTAILEQISKAGETGLRNADIGHALGINKGYAGRGRQEGQIPRTLLNAMEEEGVVEQNPTTKRWHLREAAGLASSGASGESGTT